jgi:hypothetical protein
MFSVDLTTRLLSEEYVPVLVRLREVKSKFDQEKKGNSKTDYETLMSILTGGISDLAPETIATYKKQGKRFAFVLDGFDELHASLKDTVTFNQLLKDIGSIGKVIVTSRYEQFSEYENANAGYSRTLNIDPEAIVKHLDDYLEARIEDESSRTALSGFIKNQNPDIRNNWLMVYFITNLYQREPESLDLSSEANPTVIRRKGREWYIWDHAHRRDPSLFSPIVRTPDDTDETYAARNHAHMLQCKEAYIREMMPTVNRVMTYMVVTGQMLASPGEIEMIRAGRWSLVEESQRRNDQRSSG